MYLCNGGRHGRDHMVIGFTTTYAISIYHHWSCEFESHSWQGALNTTLCYKVCQWLVTVRWFSTSTPVSSTNKTDRHGITEILLKVVLNTINQTKRPIDFSRISYFLKISQRKPVIIIYLSNVWCHGLLIKRNFTLERSKLKADHS